MQEKMRKLLIRSTDPSSTENERQVAAKVLKTLSDRYAIDIDLLAKEEGNINIIEVKWEHTGRVFKYHTILAQACARLFGGTVFTYRVGGKTNVFFAGTKDQTQQGLSLYEFMLNAAKADLQKHREKTGAKGLKINNSFLVGYALAVFDRVTKIITDSNKGLVPTALNEYREEKSIKKKKVNMHISNAASYHAGTTAGQKSNMGNKVQ